MKPPIPGDNTEEKSGIILFYIFDKCQNILPL